MIYFLLAVVLLISLVLIAFVWEKLGAIDARIDQVVQFQASLIRSIEDIDTTNRGELSAIRAHKRDIDSHITALKRHEERIDKINLQVNELSKEIAKEDNSLYNESYGDPEVIDFMDQMYLNKEGKLK